MSFKNYIRRWLLDQENLEQQAAIYWSRSESQEQQQDYSHWRGKGRWQDDAWKRIGQEHYEMFLNLCQMTGRDPCDIKTVLEWGPGGGSNAIAFASVSQRYYGVDISGPNLDECARQCAAEQQQGFMPIHIDAARPEECVDDVAGPLDLFLSTAVFQHFPAKEYGERVLAIAASLLDERGLALVQIRYDNGNPKFRSKNANYQDNAITFTSYAIDEFWDISQARGLEPLAIKLNPKVNYAYYFLRKN